MKKYHGYTLQLEGACDPFNPFINALINHIRELESNTWTLCSDNEPEDDSEVFVYTECGHIFRASYNKKGYVKNIGYFVEHPRQFTITHWRPLLEPQKT